MNILDLIRQRARHYNCPSCAAPLTDCALKMLSQVDNNFTIQVTCSICQVSFIVVLALQGPGLDELEDIDFEEPTDVVTAAVTEPISADELIELHQLLGQMRGGFVEHLVHGKGGSDS